MGKIWYILGLFITIWSLIVFSLKQCTIHTEHKSSECYNEEVSRGTTDEIHFHGDDNSFVGILEEFDGKYILTVTDTIAKKKYILMSDEPIRNTDGDINIKID